MQVTMQGDFQTGFDGVKDANGVVTPSLANIDQIDLINDSNTARQFNALNAGSIATWELINNNTNSAINLSGLANPGVTVNIHNQSRGGAAIQFVDTAVTGSNDTLNIGLDRVGTIATKAQQQQAVQLRVDDVENIVLSSTGPVRNIVDLSRLDDSNSITIHGDQAINITSMANSVKVIDGSDATGGITANGAALNTNMKSASFGSGDDTFTVTEINHLATVHGGAGDDNIIFNTATAAQYTLTMDGVETLTIRNNPTGALVFNGTNIQGLETLNVEDGVTNAITLYNYSADGLTVSTQSDTNITANGPDGVIFRVLSNEGTALAYDSTFTANEATSLTVDISENPGNTLSNCAIVAPNATSVTIISADDATGNFAPTAAVDFSNMNDLTIIGNAAVTMASNAAIMNVGRNAPLLNVDAQQSTNMVRIAFAGSDTVANQTLNVEGSLTAVNQYKVAGTYDNVIIHAGSADDVVDLTDYTLAEMQELIENGTFFIDLGEGTNTVIVDNVAVAGVEALLTPLVGTSIINATLVTNGTGALGWTVA